MKEDNPGPTYFKGDSW